MKINPFYKRIPTSLSELPHECHQLLVKNSSWVAYQKDALVVEFGHPCADVIIVRDGLVVVTCDDANAVQAPSAFVTTGQTVPITLYPMMVAPFEIRALTDTIIIHLSCEVLYEACEQWPHLALGALVSLVHRGTHSYRTSARRHNMSLEARIAHLFCDLAETQPPCAAGTKFLPFKIPQQLLAQYFNITREGLNRKLKEMERNGLITVSQDGYQLTVGLEKLFLANGGILGLKQFLAPTLSAEPLPKMLPKNLIFSKKFTTKQKPLTSSDESRLV